MMAKRHGVETQAILIVADANGWDVSMGLAPSDRKFMREVANFRAEVLDDEQMGRAKGADSLLRIESEALAEAIADAVRQCDFLRETLAGYGYSETLGGANLVATALLLSDPEVAQEVAEIRKKRNR